MSAPSGYGAQVPVRQRMPVGQSQLVVHTTWVEGRQYPMRHSWPVLQTDAVVQRSRQLPSTQSWEVAQCEELEQVPAGRGLHRPPWQELPLLQSVSAEQPKKQVAFTHQPPSPQSALKVQLVGVPAS